MASMKKAKGMKFAEWDTSALKTVRYRQAKKHKKVGEGIDIHKQPYINMHPIKQAKRIPSPTSKKLYTQL